MKMIQAFFISAVTLLICRNATAGERVEQPTNAPALIEMRDQFDALQKLSFPTTNVTILTIADRYANSDRDSHRYAYPHAGPDHT